MQRSGLDNLTNITSDPCYSAICGYTEGDLSPCSSRSFPAWTAARCAAGTTAIAGLAKPKVYNPLLLTPFDILLLFRQRKFKAHWFETGSPKFVIDTVLRRGIPTPDLEGHGWHGGAVVGLRRR